MLRTQRSRTSALVALTCTGLLVGAVAWALGAARLADTAWLATTMAGIGPAIWWALVALRRHRAGVDLIALLALLGATAVGEYFAGAMIATMLATGRALEAWAEAKASVELSLLLSRAPRSARRYRDGVPEPVDLAEVAAGDLVLVASGEVVPVDGRVEGASAVLDESALTGEPLPVERAANDEVRSGSVNAGDAFDLRATTIAAESTYAGIVRLVEESRAGRSPFEGVADRAAGWFLVLALAVAAGVWALTGDAVRAVAVLVVATPCPLILAVPVALVAGISRSASRGVVVKGGAVLERLASCRSVCLDKTGTITMGAPSVTEVITGGDHAADDVLRLAASVDAASAHVLARAVVDEAHRRGLVPTAATQVEETAGMGIRATVEGHSVRVGRAAFVGAQHGSALVRTARRRADFEGATSALVAVDGTLAGLLVLEDPIRPDAARTVRSLRAAGIDRVVMLTGDREGVARSVALAVGVDDVRFELTPADKRVEVAAERRRAPVAMIGDGVNDAPALAEATVGVAISARGATASSEAADAVLTVDRIDRVGDAVTIAKRTLHVATQSAAVGISLSLVAMGAAAAGLLAPALGACVQELIDVAAILNSLRVLRVRGTTRPLSDVDTATMRRFTAEHAAIRGEIESMRAAADELGTVDAPTSLASLHRVHAALLAEILPHERAEAEVLYPAVARMLGAADTTSALARAHVEIEERARRLGAMLATADADGLDGDDVTDLRRLLYGLHALLVFHTSQEEEEYLSLAEPEPPERAGR